MKKLFLLSLIIFPLNLLAVEKTKEEKVAKYIIQNIQKQSVITSESMVDITPLETFKMIEDAFNKLNKIIKETIHLCNND